MKNLGLYIHIPFCKRKCYYCDFISFPNNESVIDDYINAVIAETHLYEDYLKDHTINTLFIGGGTPSILTSGQISRLINGLKQSCNFGLKEATIEVNPETLNEEKLAAYSESGLNRLSIGLQTHDNEILKQIGRRHTFETFLEAYDIAKQYFRNINIDTIFGLPGQTKDSFETTINNIIELSPRHISSYSLKLEPGTRLAETYSGADEDTDRDIYHTSAEMLCCAGYTHYETSNFAKEGFECLHNMKYWLGEEYLGLGVAAHSYIENNVKMRFNNIENLSDYIQKVCSGDKPVNECSELTINDGITEYIMLRLRLMQGISFNDFINRFGVDFKKTFEKPISVSIINGLITQDKSGIYPTLKGFDLQNTLITEFMKII